MEAEIVEMLRDDHDGDRTVPWPQRRALVQSLASLLVAGDHSESALRAAETLAADPKWEVRCDVVEFLLPPLPEKDFARLAALLLEDANVFVRRAAERALDRRRKGQQQLDRIPGGFERLQSQWDAFERRYGTSAAAKARKIAEQHSDQLAGATVHEMRGILTPLKASVASMGQQLEHEPLDRADLRRQVGRAAGRIVFLERLIEDMHCYVQPVPGQRRRERLRDVIDEAVGMAQESLSAAGRDPRRVSVEVGVETHIAPGVSRYHVVAAIANVVKNAIESYATGSKDFRKGKVAVSARTANTDQVEIVIADDGCGISPTDLEEIRQFIPGKTTKKNLGTGFGLPIAKRNILAHGGDLSIVSREGEGTVITIVLPLEQDQGDEP